MVDTPRMCRAAAGTLPLVFALALLTALPTRSSGQVRDTTTAPDSVARTGAEAPDSALRATPLRVLPQAARDHIVAITTAFFDTPEGRGLLPTGMAEAAIAAEHVRVAGRDSASIRAMWAGAAQVLYAIDPALTGGGDAMGYGFRRAAEGVRVSIQLAVSVDGVPESLLYHAPFIEAAATGAIARADDAVALARQIQASTDPVATLRLFNRLAATVRAMAWGEDRDGDGRIGNDASEAGLVQAGYHIELVLRMTDVASAR